ncbi:hypothetical protein [Halobaculum marinum]|uniref:Uncharacterized protein n=1 Tax=Halobaculum marinum TaxID=3031996 RepID=A0ABD5X0J5_9EURY|nr:hypothetical protein [Halobaculum sp. DT55]
MPSDTTPADHTRPVRETLRALATGERPDGPSDAARLVADAEAAMESVERAAAFAEDGGFGRLRSVASDASDDRIAGRAREVLDALAAYRAAYCEVCDGDECDGDDSDGDGDDSDGDGDDSDESADHFHSTHDSHIPRAELPDRN